MNSTLLVFIGFLLGVSAEHGTGNFYQAVGDKLKAICDTATVLPEKTVTFIEEAADKISALIPTDFISEKINSTLEQVVDYCFPQKPILIEDEVT